MRRSWAILSVWHRPLAWLTVAMLALAAVSLLGWVVDDRVLGQSRIWAKPLKFSLSFAVYAVTLAWLISMLPRHRWLAWWSGTVLALASVLEMVAVVTQVVRGRASHFNVETPLDSAIFSTMGMLVAVIFIATLVVAVLLSVTRLADPVVALAVRLGAVITVAGMSVGFLMLAATPAAQPAGAAASALGPTGAHSVGVADGGPGLPLLGWSTTGGDLRVGHFLGIHGIQVMAALALFLGTTAGRRLDEASRRRVVVLAAAGYAALAVLTVWQALRGQSVVEPDGLTLAVSAALLVALASGALLIVRTGRDRMPGSLPAT